MAYVPDSVLLSGWRAGIHDVSGWAESVALNAVPYPSSEHGTQAGSTACPGPRQAVAGSWRWAGPGCVRLSLQEAAWWQLRQTWAGSSAEACQFLEDVPGRPALEFSLESRWRAAIQAV